MQRGLACPVVVQTYLRGLRLDDLGGNAPYNGALPPTANMTRGATTCPSTLPEPFIRQRIRPHQPGVAALAGRRGTPVPVGNGTVARAGGPATG
jgi:hypothetical protein